MQSKLKHVYYQGKTFSFLFFGNLFKRKHFMRDTSFHHLSHDATAVLVFHDNYFFNLRVIFKKVNDLIFEHPAPDYTYHWHVWILLCLRKRQYSLCFGQYSIHFPVLFKKNIIINSRIKYSFVTKYVIKYIHFFTNLESNHGKQR